MPKHLILVGLPGSGKSTVGRLVADALNAPLIDIDVLLMREMAMPVSQIFAMQGEVAFRRMERDAVRTACAREPAIIVPGAGWAAQEGELDAARATSLVVYLKCAPATALKRTEQGEGRPLLLGADPLARMRELEAQREPFYMRADRQVPSDTRPAETIAEHVARIAREAAGW
ncbi:MAG TPA: shikimate kinase [Gemmatimonadales bacterium]|nr:shikimate kinase [Gemmatimonadales bacterium]